MREEYLRKGPWYEEEDERLKAFVAVLGERRWDSLARASGLRRSGKSCRLRWLNYLRPCLKQGPISPEEEKLIIQLHEKWGNKWAKIARWLPGRTDNEIKNYWRTHLRRKTQMQNALHYYDDFSFSRTINSNSSSLETSSSSDIHTNNSNQDYASSSNESNTMTTIETCSKDDGEVFVDDDDDQMEKGLLSDNYMITRSPYENRLSDWMMGTMASEQGDELCMAHNWGSNGGCDYGITWSLGDRNNAWDDCSYTSWDIDLFSSNS